MHSQDEKFTRKLFKSKVDGSEDTGLFFCLHFEEGFQKEIKELFSG